MIHCFGLIAKRLSNYVVSFKVLHLLIGDKNVGFTQR